MSGSWHADELNQQHKRARNDHHQSYNPLHDINNDWNSHPQPSYESYEDNGHQRQQTNNISSAMLNHYQNMNNNNHQQSHPTMDQNQSHHGSTMSNQANHHSLSQLSQSMNHSMNNSLNNPLNTMNNPLNAMNNNSMNSMNNNSVNPLNNNSMNPMNNHSLNHSMNNSMSMNSSLNVPSLNQTMTRLMNQSLNNQSLNTSINQSLNQTLNPSLNSSLGSALNQALSQSNQQALNQQSLNQLNQAINPSNNNPSYNQSIVQSLNQFNQSLSQTLNQTLNQYQPSTFAEALGMPLLDDRLLAPFVNPNIAQSLTQNLGLNSTSPALNMQQAAEAFFARTNALAQLTQPPATLAQAINSSSNNPPSQAHTISPSSSSTQPTVCETVTLSTLTCLIEKQYTIRKTESDRMSEPERKQLVQVNVRILKEKPSPSTPTQSQRVTGVKRERDADHGLSHDANVVCPPLYIPATDIGPLLNIRKNNIPGYISKYDSNLRQQMMVDCPRAAGGVARVQLNVLTLAGAEKFIVTSRSKQAEKVWNWIEQHVQKVKEREMQNLVNASTPETITPVRLEHGRHSQGSLHPDDLDDSYSGSLLDLKDGIVRPDGHYSSS